MTQVEHFSQYGFEVPEFECQILGEAVACIFGYAVSKTEYNIPVKWNNKSGIAYIARGVNDFEEAPDYNLKPIVKSDDEIHRNVFELWYKEEILKQEFTKRMPMIFESHFKELLGLAWANGFNTQKNIEDYK